MPRKFELEPGVVGGFYKICKTYLCGYNLCPTSLEPVLPGSSLWSWTEHEYFQLLRRECLNMTRKTQGTTAWNLRALSTHASVFCSGSRLKKICFCCILLPTAKSLCIT